MMDMKKSLSKKILASVLAGSAVLTFAVAPYMPVSANDDTTTQPKMETISKDGPHRLGAKNTKFNERINQMVKNGKLTSEQATKLKNAMEEFKHQQQEARKDFMKSLPDKTGISQDTLKEIFRKPAHHDGQSRLAALVKAGQVTQEESDALTKFFANHKPGAENAPKSHEEAVTMMTKETGISSDRLQEIMKMMRPPMGPGPVIPQR